MNSYRRYLTAGIGLLLTCLLALPLQAAQEEIVARALLVVGTVDVVAADGTVRTLRRRDAVYEGETIRSASDGRAQLRFTDGARMSIRPDSELAIDDYEFEETAPPARVRSSLSLRRGGFRTATGAVARRNRSAYRVSTPFAVIGVRGTDWSAAIADVGQGENLFLGVNEGGITAQNNAGSIELGDDGAFNFARIRSFDQLPEGLRSLPTRVASTFSADDLPAPADGDDEEAGPRAGAGGGGGDDEDGPAPSEDGAEDGDGEEGPAGPVAEGGEEGGASGEGGDDEGGPGGALAGGAEGAEGPEGPDGPDAGSGEGSGGGSGDDIVVDIAPPAGEGDDGLVFEVTTNCF